MLLRPSGPKVQRARSPGSAGCVGERSGALVLDWGAVWRGWSSTARGPPPGEPGQANGSFRAGVPADSSVFLSLGVGDAWERVCHIEVMGAAELLGRNE